MKVILYTKEFNEKIEERVDVILSPQFYWIKKITLPLKKLSDAKSLAKTLFNLKEEEYLFGAFKIEGEFYAYAIKKKLNLKIDKKFINNIYLAQTELYQYDKIEISPNHSIQKIEGLLFCFPNNNIDKKEKIPHIETILNELKLSKNRVAIFDSIEIDKKSIISAIAVFLLLNLSFMIKIYNNKSGIEELEVKKEEFIKRYNLPSTTFQIESILNSLISVEKKQNLIRKKLEQLSKRGEKITYLAYKNGEIIYKTIDKKIKRFKIDK